MQQKGHLSIKNWAADDKPREKLLQKGRSVLSDAELIAILIGSGSKNESAVALSKRILASVDYNLDKLGKLSVKQLMKFKGVGEAKAVTIAAALEIGRRRGAELEGKVERISNSKDVFVLMRPLMGELQHEEFWALYLNNNNKVLHKAQLSKGGMTGTVVDVRLLMKQALELGAVAIIVVHNHPSGGLRPSKADKELTTKIKTAAMALDMRVLDHLIVTQRKYFSFADEGIL